MSIFRKGSALSLAAILAAVGLAGCGGQSSPSSAPTSSSDSTISASAPSESLPESAPGNMTGEASGATGATNPGPSGNGATQGTSTTSVGGGVASNSAVQWLKGKTIQIHLGVYDEAKEATTSVGKYAIQQRKNIEKKYGCKLVLKTIDYNTFLSKLMIGDTQGADIVDSAGPHVIKSALANNLYAPLDGLIDFNKPYINKTHSGLVTSGGKHYVAIPQRQGFDYIGENMVMWFNKRLVKNAGYDPDSLYKMWKDGTWTWNKMAEIASKINDPSTKTYGIGNGHGDNFQWLSLLLSNDCELLVSENGLQTYNIGNAKALEALNFWQKNASLMFTDIGEVSDSMFIQGNVGFLTQYVNRLQFSNYSKMKDDFGILPIPKGPSAKKYVSPISYVYGYAIPTAALKNDDANRTKAKALAILIDELSKPAVPDAMMSKVKTTMYESLVRDQGSYDTLMAIDNGELSKSSNYYFAYDQTQEFNDVMLQVAAGSLDVNTAVRQNKDQLSKKYRDSLVLGN